MLEVDYEIPFCQLYPTTYGSPNLRAGIKARTKIRDHAKLCHEKRSEININYIKHEKEEELASYD